MQYEASSENSEHHNNEDVSFNGRVEVVYNVEKDGDLECKPNYNEEQKQQPAVEFYF